MKNTIKALKECALYLVSFLMKGNAKLADYFDPDADVFYKYAQWNLPARRTCPFFSKDCFKFCYARRDERYESVRKNRARSLESSKRADFAAAMIHTIKVAFMTKRYQNATMILRIHESGDFYNFEYLSKWIDVFSAFLGEKNIIFCFYTKCFEYLLNLAEEQKKVFKTATESGLVSCSLSLDKSSTPEQIARAMKVKTLFPAVNIYFAIPENEIDSIAHDGVCECKDCAKCGKCVHASGKTVACAIH